MAGVFTCEGQVGALANPWTLFACSKKVYFEDTLIMAFPVDDHDLFWLVASALDGPDLVVLLQSCSKVSAEHRVRVSIRGITGSTLAQVSGRVQAIQRARCLR